MNARVGRARGIHGQDGLVLLSVIVLLLLLALLAAGLGSRLSWHRLLVGHGHQATLLQNQQRLWLAQLYALDVSFLESGQDSADCVAITSQVCGRFNAEQSDPQTWRFTLMRETGSNDPDEVDGSVAGLSGWLRRDGNDASRVALVWLAVANPP
jgi:hypothetical protein